MAKLSKEEILETLAPFFALNEEVIGVIIPSVWQVPEGYVLEKFQVKGTQVERLIPKDKNPDTIIYHLHGGGYATRYMDPYRDIAMQYSKVSGNAEVVSIDYGCAPNHVFPSALDESINVYSWMMEHGYDASKIVIIGDSAGGNLTLATTMYIRDHKLPMPKGVITFSPWTSLESTFDSVEYNKEKDLLLGSGCPFLNNIVYHPAYAGDTDKKTPYLSPLYGTYKDFPPMLVQCGDYEVLFDQIDQMAKKAKEEGVDVTYHAYPGMFHDFQLLVPALDESEEAWKEIKAFFDKIK